MKTKYENLEKKLKTKYANLENILRDEVKLEKLNLQTKTNENNAIRENKISELNNLITTNSNEFQLQLELLKNKEFELEKKCSDKINKINNDETERKKHINELLIKLKEIS